MQGYILNSNNANLQCTHSKTQHTVIIKESSFCTQRESLFQSEIILGKMSFGVHVCAPLAFVAKWKPSFSCPSAVFSFSIGALGIKHVNMTISYLVYVAILRIII